MEITVNCKIITPMFLGDADGKTAVLRPPSIKAALRFWWRALHGDLSLAELKSREGEIFGSSSGNATKSRVSINVTPKLLSTSQKELIGSKKLVITSRHTFQINLIEYLSYGTYNFKNHGIYRYNRQYILPDQKFTINLVFQDTQYSKDVIKALSVLSKFGGLGSKSRNGFGSFKILETSSNFSDIKIDRQMFSPNIPKYSAFSSEMKLWRTDKTKSWIGALSKLAAAYHYARNNIESKHNYSLRQYIGAPIIIRKMGQVSKLSRHAKPYFMSVHYEDGYYYGQILYLPSKYAIGLDDVNNNDDRMFLNACDKLNKLLSEELDEIW